MRCFWTIEQTNQTESLALTSDLSLFSNSVTFQFQFEFDIQTGAEIPSVTARSSFAEGDRDALERDVTWGQVDRHSVCD